jgi:hypothetical protein
MDVVHAPERRMPERAAPSLVRSASAPLTSPVNVRPLAVSGPAEPGVADISLHRILPIRSKVAFARDVMSHSDCSSQAGGPFKEIEAVAVGGATRVRDWRSLLAVLVARSRRHQPSVAMGPFPDSELRPANRSLSSSRLQTWWSAGFSAGPVQNKKWLLRRLAQQLRRSLKSTSARTGILTASQSYRAGRPESQASFPYPEGGRYCTSRDCHLRATPLSTGVGLPVPT